MSRVTSHSIECPSCRAPLSVQLYETVNVSLDPSLKARVLHRTLNCVKCAKCGQEVSLGVNLLYHDMNRKLMIWLRLDGVREGDLPVKNCTLRIVHTYEDLIEKILIFDTEFDDCLLELLKFMFWPQASGKGPNEYLREGHQLRLIGAGKVEQIDSLHFQFGFGEVPKKQFTYPKSEVVKMSPMAEKARAAAPLGRWSVIDRKSMLATF